ncbi:MAG TPA: ACT domain-containing protein [Patescibacteria group bacterium]|nr:ACT domain-containing protein [Patescibacteria group bacterium]
MKELTIVTDNKIGILAKIAQLLADANINIENIAAHGTEVQAIITLHVNKVKEAKKILKEKGFEVSESESLFIALPNKPGTLAEITRRLSEAHINLVSTHIINKKNNLTIIGLSTSNPGKARKILADVLYEEGA